MSSSSFTVSVGTSKSSSINSDTSSRTPAIFLCLSEEWNETSRGHDPHSSPRHFRISARTFLLNGSHPLTQTSCKHIKSDMVDASLTRAASMQIYGNKGNFFHKKRFQLPQELFGTPIWLPFHCFGTPTTPR